MADDQLKMIIEMREDIASIKTTLGTMSNTSLLAISADQSSKSAHRRIDRLEKIVNWAGTTIIGAVVVTVIGYFMNK